jgi:hypothetical protein
MKVLFGILLGLVLAGTATADSLSAAYRQVTARDITDGTHEVTQRTSTTYISRSLVAGPLISRLNVAHPMSPFGSGNASQGILFVTEFCGSDFETTDISSVNNASFGFLEVLKGTWNDPAVATEPATGLLLGLGLAFAGLMRRGKKKPPDNTVWEKLG